jgi:hypothetical protein
MHGNERMKISPLNALYDRWLRPSYERRVRGTASATYLWGSAGINNVLNFDKPPTLHIRNDLFGDEISLSTMAAGSAVQIGDLGPGECISIPLQNISGVFATCPTQSTVACLIRD